MLFQFVWMWWRKTWLHHSKASTQGWGSQILSLIGTDLLQIMCWWYDPCRLYRQSTLVISRRPPSYFPKIGWNSASMGDYNLSWLYREDDWYVWVSIAYGQFKVIYSVRRWNGLGEEIYYTKKNDFLPACQQSYIKIFGDNAIV